MLLNSGFWQQHITDILSRQHIPIVVGGTGMYLKVLLDGIFENSGTLEQVRIGLEEEFRQHGLCHMYQALKESDPEAAAKIHPHDARRILRALEVFRSTGTPISVLQKRTEGIWGKYDIAVFGLNRDRAQLYQRIDDRVEQMFHGGLIDEIRSLQTKKLSRSAGSIIGIKEIRSYLAGDISLDEAKAEMKKNTRRLAKRQLTWFRAEKRMRWIDIAEGETAAQVGKRILQVVKREKVC